MSWDDDFLGARASRPHSQAMPDHSPLERDAEAEPEGNQIFFP